MMEYSRNTYESTKLYFEVRQLLAMPLLLFNFLCLVVRVIITARLKSAISAFNTNKICPQQSVDFSLPSVPAKSKLDTLRLPFVTCIK